MVNKADGRRQKTLSMIVTLISLRTLCLRKSIGVLGLAVTAALALSSTTRAEETFQFSCEKGDLVRRVAVTESSLSSGISCEVVYWKDTEAPGVREVLWTARQDAGYCYSKALTLVDKLAVMAWTCNAVE